MRDDTSPQLRIGQLLGSALKAFRDDLYERVDAAGNEEVRLRHFQGFTERTRPAVCHAVFAPGGKGAMKRKSSLVGVAALALLLTSAVPVGAGQSTTLYTLDASCTNAVYGFMPFHVIDQMGRLRTARPNARSSRPDFIR